MDISLRNRGVIDSLTLHGYELSDVFTMNSGWTISNRSGVTFRKDLIVELFLEVIASPVAQTGARYTIATFKKLAPAHYRAVSAPYAILNNSNMVGTTQVLLVSGMVQVENFTGNNIANLMVYCMYYTSENSLPPI